LGRSDLHGGIERLVPNPEAIFTVDDKYFVYVGADKDCSPGSAFDSGFDE